MRIKKKLRIKEKPKSTWDNPIETADIPKSVVHMIAEHGTGFENGKKRVYEAVKSGQSLTEFTKTLKNEYGVGGFGFKPDGTKDEIYDFDTFRNKCKVSFVSDGEYFCGEVSFKTLAQEIMNMVEEGTYYTPKLPKLKKKTPLKKKDKKPILKRKKKIALKPLPKKEKPKSIGNIVVAEENPDGYTGTWRNVVEDGEVYFPANPEKKRTVVIDNKADLKELCDHMLTLDAFSFDTETNCLDVLADNPNFRCADITISWGENNNYDLILGHLSDEDLDRNIDLDDAVSLLKPVFEREDVLIVGANLKFDMHVMRRLGIIIKTDMLFDVMLASWICNENTRSGLKENTAVYMGVSQTKFKEATDSIPKEVKKKFGYSAQAKVKDFCLVAIDDGFEYCTDDSFYTWCLYLGFRNLIEYENMDKIYYKRMIPFMCVLLEMEEKGVTVNVDKLRQMQKDMEEDLENLTYEIYELAGVEFNIGSSQQKAELLFGYEKPDTPIEQGKASASLTKAIDRYKSKEIDKAEFIKILDKQNIYLDENGRFWKRANRNDNVLANSFNFTAINVTDKGAPSTDKHTLLALSKLSYKSKRKQQGVILAKKLLEYSKLDKLKGTFADGILEKLEVYSDGKVHTNYNQIGTDSGRISSSNPNLQQLPNADEHDKYQIRDVFVGSEYYKSLDTGICYNSFSDYFENEGKHLPDNQKNYEKKRKKLIAIDYHNLEMVCLCYFSKDKNLTEMFANDDDAHGSTAVNMFGLDCTPVECKKKFPHLRQAAKTINFMLMYGGGASTLYENLRGNPYDPLDLGAKEYLEQYHCSDGVEVAQKFIDKYFESYSGVAKFIKDQHRYAHKYGYVWTISGRKRRLPDINSKNREYSAKAERLSVNAAIQGTAGDITSSAQIRIDREQELKDKLCYMLMQVHDEIVFECPEEYLDECIEIIKHDMDHAFGDSLKAQVPYLRADPGTGDSYQEAK